VYKNIEVIGINSSLSNVMGWKWDSLAETGYIYMCVYIYMKI
jgi:hypothetical protein